MKPNIPIFGECVEKMVRTGGGLDALHFVEHFLSGGRELDIGPLVFLEVEFEIRPVAGFHGENLDIQFVVIDGVEG